MESNKKFRRKDRKIELINKEGINERKGKEKVLNTGV